MKILYHHRTRGGDAQGIHIRSLCDAFRRNGHDVQVVGLFERGRSGEPSDGCDATDVDVVSGRSLPRLVYELIALAYNLPGALTLLWNSVRSRPDFIYERYTLFCFCGYLVSRFLRVPFILEVNAPLSDETKKEDGLVFERLARRIERWLCSHATRTITVSDAMKQIFVREGVPSDRVEVIPNGIDPTLFHREISGAPVRDREDIRGRFVIGFVGWVRPWHGVDRLMDAVESLRQKIPEICLLVAGDGPALPALRGRVQQAGSESWVHFTGGISRGEVPGTIAAMDVVVQPEVTPYASPMKIFEYMAMGRGIVAPDRENIREIIEDGETGLLFSPGDTEAMANCIGRLYSDPSLRARLGRNAADAVIERGYTWDAIAARVITMADPGARGCG